MRKILSTIVLTALFALTASAQTTFNFGLTGNHTTNNNDFFFGAFAEADVKLPKHFGVLARVDASRAEYLSTLWTRDNNPTREAKGEVGIQGDLSYTFYPYAKVAPFATAGVRVLRHFNLTKPNTTFNPSVGVGATFYKAHRASFTGVIKSPFENRPRTGLTGYEADYRYTKQIGESRFSAFAGAKFRRWKFREIAGFGPFDKNHDYYSEYDNNTIFSVGLGVR